MLEISPLCLWGSIWRSKVQLHRWPIRSFCRFSSTRWSNLKNLCYAYTKWMCGHFIQHTIAMFYWDIWCFLVYHILRALVRLHASEWLWTAFELSLLTPYALHYNLSFIFYRFRWIFWISQHFLSKFHQCFHRG